MAADLDPADLACRDHPDRPAAAFGRWHYQDRTNDGFGYWWLWCQPCLDSRIEFPNFYYVRVRPDYHDPAAAGPDRPAAVDHPGHGHGHDPDAAADQLGA